jgi:molybdopterin-guanine dinucleotide biosynthesis protein B
LHAAFWPNAGEFHAADPYESLHGVFGACDLVLVEGDSKTASPKVEVWRAATGAPPIATEDKTVCVIVTDDPFAGAVTVWPRADVAGLARRVLDLVVVPSR